MCAAVPLPRLGDGAHILEPQPQVVDSPKAFHKAELVDLAVAEGTGGSRYLGLWIVDTIYGGRTGCTQKLGQIGQIGQNRAKRGKHRAPEGWQPLIARAVSRYKVYG